MTLPMTDNVEAFIKDGLRGTRYVARRGLTLSHRIESRVLGGTRFSRFAGQVLHLSEDIAKTLLPLSRPSTLSDSLVLYRELWAELDPVRFDRAFVEIHDRLLAAVLAEKGVEDAFISEREIALVARRLRQEHGHEVDRARRGLAGDGQDRLEGAALIAGVVAAVLAPSSAIRIAVPAISIERPLENPNVYSALALSLAAGVALDHGPDDEIDAGRYITSACRVVDAQYDIWLDPDGMLPSADTIAAAYRNIIPFLP